MLNIAVDVMGGDNAPRAEIEGVKLALSRRPDLYHLFLVGDETKVNNELERVGLLGDPRLEVIHSDEVVTMDDKPSQAIRKKKKSSIAVAVDLVKQGTAQAVISAGNTGAVMAFSLLKLRALPGIERPGICTSMPHMNGRFALLDMGANTSAKPSHLAQYAVMGHIYAKEILHIDNPRVGLLSVGEEDAKGNELTLESFKLISEIPHINFIGNVEGNDLFGGDVDVVVCDGFVGNVVLKASENLAKTMFKMLKRSLTKTTIRKIGAKLAYNAFTEVRDITNPDNVGGAPLMGINGNCIISHGSSSPEAIFNAVRVAGELIEHHVNDKIVELIASE